MPIELIWRNGRPPAGIVARNATLAADETDRVYGLPVTTSARTAFDLGRLLPRGEALARLDALMWAKPYSVEDVTLMAKQHRAARGLIQLRELLPLVDDGARSPKETWLRLLMIDAGFPVPTTQIPLGDGRGNVFYLDMGWKGPRLAMEYDGDQHRSDRRQYVRDRWRSRMVGQLGWAMVTVIAEDRPADIVARAREAWIRQTGSPPRLHPRR